MNADPLSAQVRFTQSCTHDDYFYAFCNGKVQTYYLRKYLDMQPHINAIVEGGLLEGCSRSLDGTMGLSCGTPAKKKRGIIDLTNAIRKYNNYFGSSEIAKQKLVYMEKEEEQRLEADHFHKKNKDLLEKREKRQGNFRLLREELHYDVLDNTVRIEIEDNIPALVKRKNQLAMEQGLK